MRVSKKRVGLAIVTLCMVAIASVAYAQATSTFNGRVLDQGDAVLPGVTITATNTATGVVRTTVTNADGSYYLPSLEPGVYEVKTELAGFAPAARQNVNLAINATLTIDFKLTVAGLNETLTLTAEAPMIEVTQSKVANTIQTTELQNLPMLTRTISGMLELLPGAAPVGELHRTKQNTGTVSFAGSSGGNVTPTVDGADNRDNHYSGPLMSFTTESLEQFQLASSQFSAADGRTGGAAASLVTKSGTNVVHGSIFGYERDKSLTGKDYFQKQANGEKPPFSRQQFGGSIGGPIVRNRMFYFGAIEQMVKNTGTFVPANQYDQLEVLVSAMQRGQIPAGWVYDKHPRIAELPGKLRTYSLKSNLQLNNSQSVMFRYAGQDENQDAVTYNTNNDNGQPDNMVINAWSAVAQHSLVLGNAGLNQITGQVNRMVYLADVVSNITGEHYTRDFPTVDIFAPRISFPSVTTGAGGDAGTQSDRMVYQIRDDLSLLKGNHQLKTGFNFNYLWHLGIRNGNEHYATVAFFDDPSVILNNTNGRYPQGFQTPGIVRMWQQANGGAVGGKGSWQDTTSNAQQVGVWFQDDWRIKPSLTLNLGLRYDRDFNLMVQEKFATNATRMALEAIGHPFGAYPETPTMDFSPRVGFAWDLSGEGTRVVRGGYGLYIDQYNTAAAAGDITGQSARPLNSLATRTSTAIGVGELSTFVFGRDPLPPQPTQGDRLANNSTGQWIHPDYNDPITHQAHIGYAHTLAANTTLAVDYTHIEGRREVRSTEANPLINGRRLLANDFQRVFGNPTYLASTRILAAINKSRYDGLTLMFQRRLPRATLQAHYTLAGAYSYGGSTGNRSGAGLAQTWDRPLDPSEWGPNGPDERHRFVATGVFDILYGIQLSPVLQLVSARPYNWTAGADLNADGNNNDRAMIDPATGLPTKGPNGQIVQSLSNGQQVSLNSARGDNTFVFDIRTTKFFNLGGGGERKIGIFAETFNVFNTANFGGQYGGNARGTTFLQPTGFIPGIGGPRQVQLGARFLF